MNGLREIPGTTPASPLRQPPVAAARDPMEAFAAQLDLGFRAANETLLTTARAWDVVFKACIDTADASRRIFGGLLVDWHQRFFPRPDR